MTTANGETIAFSYDKLKRLETISGVTGQTYSYRDIDNTKTTTQISDITYTGVADDLKLSYIYDAGGNIDTIKQNNQIIAEYAYDAQNQLVEERLPNVRYEYDYDTCHNIRQVKKYENGSTTPIVTEYGYGDADWIDLLTSYNGQAITYDNIGNPLTYNNGTAWTFTWQGAHDLATATANGKSIAYHYDMDGVRDSKTVDGVTHEYITQGGNVTLERWNDGEAKSLEFIYDNGGAPYSVIYTHGGTSETYYYILNQQGDVIRIVNGSGATVAEYTYNGWGEILSVNNKIGTFGTLNPIRYRGYYYDTELNMYYLQSRYYDPVVKRMLCADDESLTAGASLNNNNLFSYCDNNPVNRADAGGDIWDVVAGAIVGATVSVGITVLGGRIDGAGASGGDILFAAVTGAISGGFEASNKSKLLKDSISLAVDVATEVKNQVQYVKNDGKSVRSAVRDGVANVAFSQIVRHSDPTRRTKCGSILGGRAKSTKKSSTISRALKKIAPKAHKLVRKGKLLLKACKNSFRKNAISNLYTFHMKFGKWITSKLYRRYIRKRRHA